MKIHDISVPISTQMPTYPGDPAVTIQPILQIEKGDAANVSLLSMGDHTGTHIDPPVHFIPGGKTIDALDPDLLYGSVLVVDLTGVKHTISASDLEKNLAAPPLRILFKTRNSEYWNLHEFQKDYVGIAWDAAHWLVDHGVKLVGIDYLSVESFDAAEPRTHRTLLAAEIVVLEGIDLRGIAPGEYTLACLPLKIHRGDGGPCRAILIS